MNIFILHRNPTIAAQMSCDKHVVKMPLESAQMLSTIAVGLGHEHPLLYKPVHAKHPCTLWAGENVANWRWLCKHGIALCKEYTYRYGRVHKSQEVIWTISRKGFGPKGIAFLTGMTKYAQAMPDQYKNPDPVKAYRDYYKGEKHEFAKWTRRSPPGWWMDDKN